MNDEMTDPTIQEQTVPPPHPLRDVPLRRSQSERMVAGIAGGIAERYGWDPVLVRIVFVLVALVTSGAGVVAYAIAWVLIPETSDAAPNESRVRTGSLWGGAVLLGIGGLMVLDELDIDTGPARILWPMLLIGAGTALLVARHRTPIPTPNRAEPSNTMAEHGPTSAYRHAPWPNPPGAETQAVVPTERPRALTSAAWGLVLLYFGGVSLVAAATDVEMDVVAVLAGALGLVGLLLIVSAWWGRARGLIAFGFVLVIATGVLALLHVPLRGGIGERVVRPMALAEVEANYELAIGQLDVDLRSIDVPPDERIEIEITNAIGEVNVFVPDDVGLEIRAQAGAGEIDLLDGPTEDGTNIDRRVTDQGTDGGTIVLDVQVGLGAITVERAAAAEVAP